MNSPFMLRQAEDLADRLAASADDDPTRVRNAYLLLFSREPTPQEARLATAFLDGPPETRRSLWVQYAQVLLASNELLILD